MPYIKPDRRKDLAFKPRFTMKKPGELNYVIHQVIADYLQGGPSVNYEILSSVVGVLEDVKHEIQRRLMDPLENKKCNDNGDVEPYISIGKEL